MHISAVTRLTAPGAGLLVPAQASVHVTEHCHTVTALVNSHSDQPSGHQLSSTSHPRPQGGYTVTWPPRGCDNPAVSQPHSKGYSNARRGQTDGLTDGWMDERGGGSESGIRG